MEMFLSWLTGLAVAFVVTLLLLVMLTTVMPASQKAHCALPGVGLVECFAPTFGL